MNVAIQPLHGVEVIGNDFLVLHLDAKGLLHKKQQFQDTGGIYNAIFEKGSRIFQLSLIFRVKEIVEDIAPNLMLY